MKTYQFEWKAGDWSGDRAAANDTQLVLLFGAGALLRDADRRSKLRGAIPDARIIGCSTAGEILGSNVSDGGAVALVITFESTLVRCAKREVASADDSHEVGVALSRELAGDDLRHVMLLSNGLKVNGTLLVEGLRQGLPEGGSATGGLAGDGSRFEDTTVVLDDEVGSSGVIAVGLYGDDLEVSWGSSGGWEAFGPRRRVTRSQNNVLFELNDRPALELYKTYLGERAAGLPATGLLFPLELLPQDEGEPSLVRTMGQTMGTPTKRADDNLKILVVDDNPINRKVLGSMLKVAGYSDVSFEFDGAKALASVQCAMPDIIFMDVEMPVMDGMSATSAIRDLANSNATRPWIIGLSTNIWPDMVRRSQEVGMNNYLSKPVRRAQIEAAINERP